MAEVDYQGSGQSCIRCTVDIKAKGEGRSWIRLRDGTQVEGPDSQRFCRVEQDQVKPGDWLLNCWTNELHQVLEIRDCSENPEVKISTVDGSVWVPWDEIPNTLIAVQR